MTDPREEMQVPSQVVDAARGTAVSLVQALRHLDDDASATTEERDGAPAQSGSAYSFATAESLTSGLVASLVAEVPGVSRWFLGGVVAYSYDAKERLLGIDRGVLERDGAVTAEVAISMARNMAERLGARWAVSTTGVAGPGPADGRPEGTVWIGVVDRETGTADARLLQAGGGRDEVRWRATVAALEALLGLAEQNRDGQR